MTLRKHIHFRGRVQGVGFRFTAQSIAAGFRVTGFVKNLSNGEVELVAEGEPEELRQFLATLRDEMAVNIHGEQSTDTPGTGEFSRFEIRY